MVYKYYLDIQKQPSKSLLRKMCSEYMQQIYCRTPHKGCLWISMSKSQNKNKTLPDAHLAIIKQYKLFENVNIVQFLS